MAIVENRVFVSGVPPTASKDDLISYFGQFGLTSDVYMPRRFGTEEHKGMGFITYADVSSVQMALSQPGHFIHGLAVTVEQCFSKDKGGGKGVAGPAGKGMPGSVNTGDRLFITKIPPEATREEVEALFSRFGQWTDVYLPAGNFPAGHKGICFISYADSQSAELAMSCGPHQLRGQDLVVEIATPRESKGGGKGSQMSALQTQTVVQQVPVASWPPVGQGIAGQGIAVAPPVWGVAAMPVQQVVMAPQGTLVPGRLFLTKVPEEVTKEDLTLYFQQYGMLQDVYVPPGKSIAFVSFIDASTTQRIITSPQHEVKVGSFVTVDLAYDRPPLEAKGKGKFRYQPYG